MTFLNRSLFFELYSLWTLCRSRTTYNFQNNIEKCNSLPMWRQTTDFLHAFKNDYVPDDIYSAVIFKLVPSSNSFGVQHGPEPQGDLMLW